MAGIPGYQQDVPGTRPSRCRGTGSDTSKAATTPEALPVICRRRRRCATPAAAGGDSRGGSAAGPPLHPALRLQHHRRASPDKVWDASAEVAIVRSAFGYPATVNDGQTIFRNYRTTLFPDDMPDDFYFEPIYDVRNPATGGKPRLDRGALLYYSLFFPSPSSGALDVHVGGLPSGPPPCPAPVQHRAAVLPVGGHPTAGRGRPPARFLRVFGFELDQTYVEQWQELYHIDFSGGLPRADLRHPL